VKRILERVALRVSIEVVLIASAFCVCGCAGATADEGNPPDKGPAPHDGGVHYANDAGSSPHGDAAQDPPHDSGGGPLGDAPPTDDVAQPPPTNACAKNEDCPGFRADAGIDGDVGEFCLLEGCNGTTGMCTATSPCEPNDDPFCACDGKTYPSQCDAFKIGVSVQPGPCTGDDDGDDSGGGSRH